MASHAHEHVDGKWYRADFVTGRPKIDPSIKKRATNLTLDSFVKSKALEYCADNKISLSAFVDDALLCALKLYKQ